MNSDFYPNMAENDRKYLQQYLNRIMYDAIQGEEDFYIRIENCMGCDERKHRQQLHKVFWSNLDSSIRSVQKDFPDFMEDWVFGVMQ